MPPFQSQQMRLNCRLYDAHSCAHSRRRLDLALVAFACTKFNIDFTVNYCYLSATIIIMELLGMQRSKKMGWSTWSEWFTCSRTCDGGVTYQLRTCHSQQGCKGEAIRYKICNMQVITVKFPCVVKLIEKIILLQPCPDHQDFRALQCAAYNNVPYDGALFTWEPHYDYSEPCALTCK